MDKSPQDAVSYPSIYEVLDIRRIPYKDSIDEIRARFGSGDVHRRGERIVLRGLEPLILSMTEPLECFAHPGQRSRPPAFVGTVDVHATAAENFETAKTELAALLGPGLDPRRRPDLAEQWWNGGKVQIAAARPQVSRQRSLLDRLIGSSTTAVAESACHVRIETDYGQESTRHSEFVNPADPAVEIARRYSKLVDRVDGPNPPGDDELAAMRRELVSSAMDLASWKGTDMSPITTDQELRAQHVVSLMSEERRLSYQRYKGPPSPDALKEARDRLAKL